MPAAPIREEGELADMEPQEIPAIDEVLPLLADADDEPGLVGSAVA